MHQNLFPQFQVKIWAYQKIKQTSLLVYWADSDVYAREAIDIHVDETPGLQYKEVKNPMIEIMRELPDEAPNATHVALTHNGICWEIAGLAYNKTDNSEIEGGQPTNQQEEPEKNTPIRSPHPTAIKPGMGNMSKVLFFFLSLFWDHKMPIGSPQGKCCVWN